MQPKIKIIRPSSREKNDTLLSNISVLKKHGFSVIFDDLPFTGDWNFTSNSVTARSEELNKALLDDHVDIVWASRGGYGASDLLDNVEWEKLKTAKPKILIGFSDITALHSALFSKLGWQGIHAPMPITELWNKDHDGILNQDLQVLFDHLTLGKDEIKIPLFEKNESTTVIPTEGWLFGGCFSVLTNLIGTPYFPDSLDGSILFLEDVSEHPAKLLRYFNQWTQSQSLNGVRAIVLGQIIDPSPEQEKITTEITAEFEKRSQIPVFNSSAFGHLSPNFPLKIGAQASIVQNTNQTLTLVWSDRR
jgi:muramoyltetrapeptide carboxypeptidase